MKKMFKVIVRTVTAALLCVTLAQTAWAAPNDNKNVLKSMFNRVDYYSNFGLPNAKDYVGRQLTDKQVAILEKISDNLNVEAVVKNGVSFKPILAIGDKNIAYVVWEITAVGEKFHLYYGEKPDIQSNRRKLDGLQYTFDNMDRSYQMQQMMAENYDAFSTVTVGDNPPGSYGLNDNIRGIMKDENPDDNKVWLLTIVKETRSNIDLCGETLHFHITNFCERFGSESGEDYMIVAKGPWDFSIPLNYKDSIKKTTGSKTVNKVLGSASETMRIDSIEISPLSLVIKGNKWEIMRDKFSIVLKKKDGSTQNMDILVTGYNGGVADSSNKDFWAEHFFEEPLDVDEIVSIHIGDTEFPLK